jgi:hypothetical protein
MNLNLPPLAGLASLAEAAKPGLAVAECVRRLKRLHYAFKRLHEILTARITSEPHYELKTAFAHHAYLCGEHVAAIRQRVGEMREPPLGLDDVPHPALEVFFDELRGCRDSGMFCRGVYHHAVGWLRHEIEAYGADTNPLTDAPSRRVLKFARLEVQDMWDYGMNAVAAFGDAVPTLDWDKSVLWPLLAIIKGDDSRGELPRRFSLAPWTYDPVPRRDERFTDLWNQGVNAEAFLYDETKPADAKALMMLFKRLREIDVPEMMASIIVETPGKPWDYYRAMSRQLWDEARHAMMGEVGFTALGVDWTQAKITWNWSYRLNTECTPLERHGVLFFIEQGLMPKTGKRYEFEVATESGIPLVGTIQDFDWADEVLHSQIGREWYVSQFANLKEALEFGDKAWTKITSNWTTVRDRGLTNHDNWWPAIYRQACAAVGRTPDDAVLAFDVTYDGKRADTK